MESQVSRGPDPARARLWKTTFISLSVATVVLFIIGGAVYGTSYGVYYDYYFGTEVFVNYGQYIAGIVFLALAGCCFIAWVTFLVLRFTDWYKGPAGASTTSYASYANEPKGTTTAPAATVAPVSAEPKVEPAVTSAETGPAPTHFCSNCEHQTTGSFCGNCGTKVQ